MSPVIAFARAFPQTKRTLCTEMALVWLAQRDPALSDIAPRFSWRIQRRLWARAGFLGAVREIGARIGYALQPARDGQEGEVIIARDRQGAALLGLMGPGGRFVGASFGTVVIAKAPVLYILRRCEAPVPDALICLP